MVIARLFRVLDKLYKNIALAGHQLNTQSLVCKMTGAVALAGCFAAVPAFAGITRDATSQGTVAIVGTTSPTSLSFTHQLGVGPNRLVLCGVLIANSNGLVANTTPTVTFNGITMHAIPETLAPTTTQAGTSRIEQEMYYLNDTDLGSASGSPTVSVSVTTSTQTGLGAICTSFFDVAQGPPEAKGQFYNGNLNNPPTPSVSLATVANGDLIVDFFGGGFNTNSSKTASPNAGQNQLYYYMNSSGGFIIGSSYELAVAPNTYVPGWTSNASRGTSSAVAFAPAVPEYIVTPTVNPAGAGTITLSPNQPTYTSGTSVTVAATSAGSSIFTGFIGDLTGSANPSTLVVDSNKSITANFAAPMCNLTVTSGGNGGVSANPGSGSLTCGTPITLTATPDSGYTFTGWSGNGYSGTNNPATFSLIADTTEIATFTKLCTLTTSVAAGAGTITPASGSSYPCGTQVTVQAFPAAQYLFASWGGGLSGNTNPATLTLNSNANVSATFNQNTSSVTGDSRAVVEPKYPPVCSTLSAQQVDSSLQESMPDTARVQAALNACAPGQAVEFSSSGAYNSFIIAPINLPAGVTMLVDPDVTIFGSINSADYSCNTSSGWCTPLIDVLPNADPAPGSGIMGLGVIDGRGGVPLTDTGTSWWASLASGTDARPRLIYLGTNGSVSPADNFTLYKITLRNSPKFHVSGVGNNLTVWGIRIYAPPDSPNTDGIDPSGSKNITITNSYISDGDDHIAPKAGVGHVSNVSIYNNHFYSGHGISVGSETNAGLNNMYVHDNAFDVGANYFGGGSAGALRIKSDVSRGGEVHDVLYQNTCINNGGNTLVFNPYYSVATGSLIPNFHDITISNLHQLVHSSHKSTLEGYNTNGTVYPLTLTLDNVAFDGAVAGDFAAPGQVNNAQITLGPGAVNFAQFLQNDATNNITIYNNVSNSNAPLDCSNAFVYLTGDLTAPTNSAVTGHPFTVTAVLQNVVSPTMSGGTSVPQQNMPSGGTIQILEGTNVVASASTSGVRLTGITIPSMTTGTHVYTAKYLGDTNYATPFSFGSITVNSSDAAPVATSQSVTVVYNTPTPITLSAAGTGTLTYSVVTNPAHGTLGGAAPNLTYTPAPGYAGVDSFTFKANNGTDSNVATVNITVKNAAPVANNQSVTMNFNSAAPITLSATGNGALSYSVVTNPAHGALSGTAPNLTYTPASGYAGVDSFTFKANNGTDSNVATVSITVSAGFTWTPVSGGSTTATVTAGQPAIYNLQFAGWAGATGTVTFSCTGAPVNATCTVYPGTATLAGVSPISVNVTVMTGPTTVSMREAPASPSGPRKGLPAAVLAGLFGFVFGLRRRRAVVSLLYSVILCLALSAACLVTGCGGSQTGKFSNAASGTYHLTVTATASGVTQSTSLTLNVQ